MIFLVFITTLILCLFMFSMPTIYSIIKIGWRGYKKRIYFFKQIIKNDIVIYSSIDIAHYIRISPIIINYNHLLVLNYDSFYIEYFKIDEYIGNELKKYKYEPCSCIFFNHLRYKAVKKLSKINVIKLDKISDIDKIVNSELKTMKRDRILNSVMNF